MTLAYAKQLGFHIQKTDIRVQKFNGSLFWTFGIVIAVFQVENKLGKARFFQELFLLANTSIEVVLRMLFLILNNTNIQFTEKKLT